MTDTERLLDNLLNDVAEGRRTTAECLSLCQVEHPDLVSPLELAFALNDLPPDDSEVMAAQQNVWEAIAAKFDDNVRCDATLATAPARRILPFATRIQRRRWTPLAICAAMFALVLMGVWIATVASADALPGSPLYGVKRADEDFQLRIAWSSQMRSQALAQIALHRLDEARAEAARGNETEALTLMDESDAATRQLIDLAVSLKRDHQNDTAVQNALAATLRAEYDALHQAQNSGQTMLAQALSVSVADQQQVMSASDIKTPPSATPSPTSPPNATHPAHTPHATPSAHPTPPTNPTPPAHPTPGSGNGNGNGNGSNNGNGSGNNGNGNGNGKSGHP